VTVTGEVMSAASKVMSHFAPPPPPDPPPRADAFVVAPPAPPPPAPHKTTRIIVQVGFVQVAPVAPE
jgi:hypothetical protein